MRKLTSEINRISLNPWFMFFSGTCTMVCFLVLVYDKITNNPIPLGSTFSFSILVLIWFTFSFYSITVRLENIALKKMASFLHQINHNYRDVLYDNFAGDNPITSKSELIAIEKQTLTSACHRISKLFTSILGNKECMVSIKLIIKESSSNRKYCKTYVRSEEQCIRDNSQPIEFEIGTGQNTAFDNALRLPQPGKCSHYYSADLKKEQGGKYNNQRPSWENFYQSTIVVPIRRLNSSNIETSDDIAFLCIDTMSTNRLNDNFHVELLASFADQMYNFISLMRGRYSVLVSEK